MSKAFKELGLDATPLAAAIPAFCASIPAGELRGICEQARARKARLVALWGSDETVHRAGYMLHLALGFPSGLLGERPAFARGPALSRNRRHLPQREPHAARHGRSARNHPFRGRRPAQVAAARGLA